MAAENAAKATEEAIFVTATATAATKQRKKRKWDEPAESLVSAGLIIPGAVPLGTGVIVGGPVSGLNPLMSGVTQGFVQIPCGTSPQLFQSPMIPQNTAAVLQKLNLPKIQDEVIAREIVINDAESTIRYRLTKRQTQEEIQKSTGAVVITRGKYRPPNSLPDGEKPLYLHISAGAQLKDTAERIKAVDLAASIVEEILKHGHAFQPGHCFPQALSMGDQVQISHPLSTCVYLGFDPDPSLNIAARIRGPNDQYISHIMNVTGATLVLRGRGLRHPESSITDEADQPLHLFLSSTNPRNLEEARILAENLLDTISIECGISRMTPSKVYNAVPPPQQLLVDVQGSTADCNVSVNPVSSSSTLIPSTATNSVILATPTNASASMPTTSTIASTHFPTPSLPNLSSYPTPTSTKGTSYTGYGGIYPQATPLQQVAQALRNAPASAFSSGTIATSSVSTSFTTNPSTPKNPSTVVEADRRSQRRKFQELPAMAYGSSTALQISQQESEFLKPGAAPYTDIAKRDISSMPPPRKLVQPAANGVPPPPIRSMPMLPTRSMSPRPPKSMSPPSIIMPPPPSPPLESVVPKSAPTSLTQGLKQKPNAEAIPDPLLKLMEYGDDDDDTPDGMGDQGLSRGVPVGGAAAKPFWAV